MKLTVLGKGTAGSLTYNHFSFFSDMEIECIYDSNIQEQSVGEGSTLQLPRLLSQTINLKYEDLYLIDGNYKKGIHYINWGNRDYFHNFSLGEMSIHFNAVKLQELLYKKNKNKVKFIDKNINSYGDVDSDYIIDCRGKPNDYTDYYKAKYIPINSALITHCSWDKPIYDYTLCIARPYGWVFAIPLQNRVSFGYLFKEGINTKKEIEDDLNNVLKELGYTSFTDAKHIKFDNYYRKQNYTDRVFYNGNASFFLEPMEATSLTTVDRINRNIFDIINYGVSIDTANQSYIDWFKECQDIITLHYLGKPRYDTRFWKYAHTLAQDCWSNASDRLIEILNNLDNPNYHMHDVYGTWYQSGFIQNMKGLGINYVKK